MNISPVSRLSHSQTSSLKRSAEKTIDSSRRVLAFTAPGATLLSCKCLEEVHSGDTLYSTLEIVDLSKEGPNGLVTKKVTVFNPRKQFVLLGEHKYLLKRA
jgi:acyl dehydratase